MSSDFLNLLERLVNAGVDFVIVGGFAGVVHGCTYVTQDLDICCDFSPANLLALQKAIYDLHPVHRMTANRKKLNLTKKSCRQFKNLYLDTDIGQLDCLGFIDGVGDYRKVKRTSELVEVQDMRLRVLSLVALIKARKAMNRPRDKEAILQLEAIKRLKSRKGKPY
ncbi:MAG: nucleotidyltransferase [Sedimentisphaerales bacterium]